MWSHGNDGLTQLKESLIFVQLSWVTGVCFAQPVKCCCEVDAVHFVALTPRHNNSVQYALRSSTHADLLVEVHIGTFLHLNKPQVHCHDLKYRWRANGTTSVRLDALLERVLWVAGGESARSSVGFVEGERWRWRVLVLLRGAGASRVWE